MREGYILNGRYQIIRSLGEGGMANVYEARDLILQRNVAVKLLRLDLSDDQATIRRFQGEAMSLVELTNPHIVSIYDIGEENSLQYLVMEYVKGMNLKEYIEQCSPIPYQRVIEIMEQILNAVSEAHANGIIHRDLKPQNILLDEQGNVKITDFGIAIAAAQSTITKTNTMLGSVHYISPEQARGSIITSQSDIYSLGIILFELLTGHVPFEGQTAVSIALKHYNAQMPSVREFVADIPQPLENVVLHATAKKLTDRYKSAGEMAVDLRTALQPDRQNEPRWQPHSEVDQETQILPRIDPKQIVNEKPTTTMEDEDDKVKQTSKKVTKKVNDKKSKPKKKWSKKKKIAFTTIGLILLAIILFIGYVLFSTPQNTTLPDVAGLTEQQAKQKLMKAKLEIGEITYTNDDKIAKDHVIKTTPSANTEVREGASIDMVVSSGPQKQAFGDYRGQVYADVKSRLEKQGVTVRKKESYSDEYAKDEIIEQSVKSSKKVVLSSTTVTFVVSKGNESYSLRDLTNYTLKSVQDYASDLGLKLQINKEYNDTVANDMVITQQPSAGSDISEGDTLTVTISQGKDPAKEDQDDQDSYTSFTISVNVPFQPTANQTSNKIQVYIEDKDHSLSNVYQSFDITNDTSITIPFVLEGNKAGKYKIYRDGQLVAQNDNVKN